MDWSNKQHNLERFLASRRQVLKGGLAGAAALTAPGAVSRALAAPADPLHFVGWQYNPQIVEENVQTFIGLYDENVNYELVPGEYHAVTETKLIAGQHIDMMYSEEDRIVRWNAPAGPAPSKACPVSTRSRPRCTTSTSTTCPCPTAGSAVCPITPASTLSSATRSTLMPPASSRPLRSTS